MKDIQGAMDWLARKFNESNSLDINLTNQVKDSTRRIDRILRCNPNSDDSDYKEGVEDEKTNFSDECGDIIGESSNYKIDDIDVNDDNDNNTNSPDDLFNVFLDPRESWPHGRSQHNDIDNKGKSQDGQPH
jgi:hypothetical protein